MSIWEIFKKTEKEVKPKTGKLISGIRDDWRPQSHRKALTPEVLKRMLRYLSRNTPEYLQEVWDFVEEDPHVYSVMSRRRRAVYSRRLQISSSISRYSETGKGLADDAAEHCRAVIFGYDGFPGIGNLTESLKNLTDAIGRAYSLCQIVWDVAPNGMLVPVLLEHWPHRETIIGTSNPYTDSTYEEVLIKTSENKTGELLARNGWILHVSKARTDTLIKSQLYRILAWWVLFKRFSTQDWSIYNERYGMPARKGTYPLGTSDADRESFRDAVINMGRDLAIVGPEGIDVEFVQAGTVGEIPYERMINVCNSEISKAVQGNSLTTEVGKAGGNRSLGEVMERYAEDIAQEDSDSLALTLRNQLIKPIINITLGSRYPIPEVAFVTDKTAAGKEDAERDSTLIGMGLRIGEEYLYKKYQIPAPEDGESVISKQQTTISNPEDNPINEEIENLKQEAEEAQLSAENKRNVIMMANRVGVSAARWHLQLCAEQKKKSQVWVL